MDKIEEVQTEIQCIDVCKYTENGCSEDKDQDEMFVVITHQIRDEKDKLISEYGHCMDCSTPVAYHDKYTAEWESSDKAELIWNEYYIRNY